MPVQPTYPGVYVEEIPSGVRPVPSVSTSIGAFIGSFRKGLLNEAVRIFSWGDFEREYGGLDRNSETSYAIQQFFLNGGTQAVVVRVADTAAPDLPGPPVVQVNANAATVTLAAGANNLIFTAGRRIRGESAVNPGEWGNSLRVEVDYNASDPVNQFNLTIQEVRTVGDRTLVLQTESFRNLSMVPDTPLNVVEVVNQGSKLVQITTNPPVPVAPFTRPESNGTLSGALDSPFDINGVAVPTYPSIPADGDAFNINIGNGIPTINGTLNYDGSTPTTYPALLPFIEGIIRDAADDATVPDGLKPLLAGAQVKLLGDNTAENPSHFHIQLGRAARPYDAATTVVFSGAGATEMNLTAVEGATENAQQTALADGRDGPAPAVGTTFRPIPVGFFQGQQAAKTGLYALEDVDLFNILCIPEATTLAATAMRTLYSEAISYVEDRRSMLIIDIPANVNDLGDMQTWLNENNGLRHPNTAVYFPRTNVADPLNENRPRSIPSCGAAAGLWARTDTNRGVWKAPAGTEATLRNVESLAGTLTDQQNGVLNPLGANCLRNFPVYGNIIWGARTLDGADLRASDWKYIPVRRTALFIEESLFRGTKWVVFEPNDEPLWSQIRLNLGTFMQDLFRKGAFQGSTPREAYFVKCDSETTTQSDIDNGIVNIEIGFAPLKPAEFVILKIQQIVRRPEA
ncbi:MAG: phage tail protein [Candidatus Nitronauta litoralis]|uniref:Phage tail protein n=1 Tax=Candidatus Nitronauta litoralis TaxID=2705533 RepID=A0A7T0BWU3_9BACT|nr:MAG: phage tail protein [Candidatus Nitronauta litoralis]